MTTVVVEYKHDPPLTDAARAEHVARLRKCTEVREVTWLHTYLSLDRATMFAVFEAPSAEVVRVAHHSAGIAFVRAVPATAI